ncbi:hypothetical protein BJX70DRAFT_389269 [Aspergillus crustosus]
MTKDEFDQAKAYAPQEEGTGFFDDGREIELLHFVYSHPDLESIRGSPDKVLDAIDEYGRTKKYLMNVGEDKGRIVCDLIAEVKPKTMVELGGYVGYSCILFGDAVRKAGGSRYYSLEMNPEFAAVIMSLVDLAGLSDIVKVVVGPSDASIARLYSEAKLSHIDLLFLDHYKPAYVTDLKFCEETGLVASGSVLAADNVIKPGNPPYLEYVRGSVEEKKEKIQKPSSNQGIPGTTVNQYQKQYGAMSSHDSPGNPNLIYESKLVHSFEPTGVPNILLILLSAITLPISALITLVSLLVSLTFQPGPLQAPIPNHGASQRKTILVTGVSMTKGLTIARVLAKATPHRIIAADTEPIPFTSPGRYSRSITRFYALDPPEDDDPEPYIESLLSVINDEAVDLWISCSSVVGAVEDGEVLKLAKEERGPGFQAVQFDPAVVERFHRKDAFIEYIRTLGLLVPESYRCMSADEVTKILHEQEEGKWFLLKPIGVDDKARSQMMTLLPLPAGSKATSAYISTLGISPSNPFILQQFVTGSEYCTHALIIRGRVRAFVACPSSDLLMHYQPLSPASALNIKMLEFTKRVAEDGGKTFTGHLSFDFLVEDGTARLFPIECNPRAHTAVVFFQDTPELAKAYLSCLARGSTETSVVSPAVPPASYYWIGHDIVTLLIMPFLGLLSGEGRITDGKEALQDFCCHLFYWRDGTFVTWDPMPFFLLYHVYWPCRFVEAIVKGRRWSRVNVSTTKMFAE